MSAWESEDWFLKWLELARIEMAGEENLSDVTVADAASDTPLGCSQLSDAEEHQLAA